MCEHLWIPPGADFAIFQCCHHCPQCTEADSSMEHMHSFLVIIHQFAWKSWSTCSSFCGVRAVHDHLELGLSFMCLLPLLKHTIRCLTVLTSTGWSPSTFSKCQWMSMGAIFSTWKNSVKLLCFIHTDTILSDCPSAAICHTARNCNGILVGRFNFYCHPTYIHLWCHGSIEKK